MKKIEVQVLGTGCPKCKNLEKLVREVVEETQIEAEISKVEDIVQIMNYGIISTPGLVINSKVVFSGRVPSRDEVKQKLQEYANA